MSTPNDSIDLRDYFAAAALSGIVVKRTAEMDTAFDLPDATPTQKTAKAEALAVFIAQFSKDVRLAYKYADAAMNYRDTSRKEVKAAEALAAEETAA